MYLQTRSVGGCSYPTPFDKPSLVVRAVYLRENNILKVDLPLKSSIKENGTPPDVRTHEGSLNNQDHPTMGMTRCPFARNTPPLKKPSGGPDAGLVSEKILKRPGGRTKTRVGLLLPSIVCIHMHTAYAAS